MPKVKLDAPFVARARCEAGRRKTDYYDAVITGFVLEARASGGKTYYLRYDADGRQVGEARVPGIQSSCPAFGGENLATLFVTTAAAGLSQEKHALNPGQGRTYAVDLGVRGQPEHRVAL